ncbi:MAG TPA: DUF1206 domain-containing protein [Acidimicrobiales bacterium]|nr:DUF1206 domain-containing protein [Acidimicrobiales bacterium]
MGRVAAGNGRVDEEDAPTPATTTAKRQARKAGRTASARGAGAARRTQRRARRAKSRPLVARLARTTVAARGAVYLLLAYLAADIAASGARGKPADTQGALEELRRQPGGVELLGLLAVGLLAYAAWRFLQAAAGDRDASAPADAAKRAGWALIGVAYLGLTGQAVALLVGGGSQSEGASSLSRTALAHPGGRVLLAVAGLAAAGGGLGLMVWAVLQRFETYLDRDALPKPIVPVVRVVETAGHVVRGLVFAAVGASFVMAAVTGSAHDAKDLDGALRLLRGHWSGRPVLALVAAGLSAFALSSFFEAAYRES